MKLVVGQLRTLPLDRVLHTLRQAQGQKADELYRFIYWNSWRQLSAEALSLIHI